MTSSPAGLDCGATCGGTFPSGVHITLTAAAPAGSIFAGWSGGGCSGVAPCTVTLAADTMVTATFNTEPLTNLGLVSAVLPASRSVQLGKTANAFATMINTGPGTGTACSIQPATAIPATFLFQTTNPITNAVSGTLNAPVDIAEGAAQSFVIAFTPTAEFAPTDVAFTFTCANAASPAPSESGLNTLLLSGSASPVPDIVALAVSSDPGIVDISGNAGTGAFAVATVNLGIDSVITATADTNGAALPLILTLCQSDPASGACISATGPSVSTTIAANATPTFVIFVQGNGTVPFAPATNRVFMRFKDSTGAVRGATSVAVRTQ